MVRTILLATTLLALPAKADYTIPVMSARSESASYRTTLFIENVTDNDVTCRFTLPNEEATRTAERLKTTIFPQFLRHLTAPATVNAACPGEVDIFVRIQTSRDRGRTWDRGRIFEAMTAAAAPRHRMPVTSDLVVGESTGQPADVRMTIRRGEVVTRNETVRFEAGSLTLMTFGDGEPLDPDLTVEFEVIKGEGRLSVGQAIRSANLLVELEHRERMAFRDKSVSPDNMRAARMLGISPFKAAPFQDPATGLIYMRERWYDPRTGTFLTPDPMGFLDSSNTYAYGAGDPVNNSDPTGLALYAFDGTWNDRDKMKNDTNVAKLAAAYRGTAVYKKGVGTDRLSRLPGGVAGWGAMGRVRSMVSDLTELYNRGDHEIDVIGFSRGASQALTFVNEIARYGIYDQTRRTRVIPDVRFLGLFDTVGSFGIPGDNINIRHVFSIPPNVKTVRHAIAGNEYRRGFPLTRLTNTDCPSSNIVEAVFRGAHADVGGGYEDNDLLSRHPLQWMWQQMVAADIQMRPIAPNLGTVPPGAAVRQHRSHESILYLPDWLRVEIEEMTGRQPRRTVYTAPCYERW